MATLNGQTSVMELNDVGKVRAKQLEKLGIYTLSDLIYFFPRAYEKRGDIHLLSSCDLEYPKAYILTVANKVSQSNIRRGLTISNFGHSTKAEALRLHSSTAHS